MNASEIYWLWAGLAFLALAALLAIRGVANGRLAEKSVLISLAAAVALLAMAIAVRWLRLGHGPFVTLFEYVLSHLFSLGLVFTIVYWRIPLLRPTAAVVLPLIWLLLGFWMLTLEPKPSHLPATFENYWLWAHVAVGKIFLGLNLVGVGIAGVIMLRHGSSLAAWFSTMPGDLDLDRLAWNFMAAAFVFHSLMLIAGAVWAQDAWGRYWAWDPLETSAFVTWLAMGLSLHARLTWRVPVWVSCIAVFAVFILAFTTFFGIPFLSETAHKGAV
ncbi:MAG: cytochrome c biogenesis protein CcsA [Mariprofundaceae bacterium]